MLYKPWPEGGKPRTLLTDEAVDRDSARSMKRATPLAPGWPASSGQVYARCADRALQLVRAGRSVRIVTDHGWLLMPGGCRMPR